MYALLKKLFDLLVASLMLAILSPVLAGIVVAIRLTSRGPAIFRQERAGQNGRPFTFYKFRTMRRGADPFGPSPKSGDDPRLTKIGGFLRESSFDELPQLVNILRGDMSLVGPRPLYVAQVAEWDERQRKRLLVKPGLTGLAPVCGRGELRREEKLELDVKYVEQVSLGLDARILLATFVRVFARQGIYEKRYSRAECTRRRTRANREE
ncbi:MAG: sugar transferase [Phycisphaerae bacterium]|nr:sugar transferase [Phycisphaerae bacterium]